MGVWGEIDGVVACWLIDGAHRLSALLATGNGDLLVPVMEATVQGDARESDLFLKLNDRTLYQPIERFRNAVQARRFPEINIYTILRHHGWHVANVATEGALQCPEALISAYRLDDGKSLAEALDLLTETWGYARRSGEGHVIMGLALVCKRYGPKAFDRHALGRKLAKYPGGAAGLVGAARGLRSIRNNTSVAKCVAELVVDEYNKGRTSGRLPDWKA